jgi:hypothetical protein
MNKRILVAVFVLVLASLACGRQLEKWEMTLVNDLTLDVCVTGEGGARFTNRQGFVDVIPKGQRSLLADA